MQAKTKRTLEIKILTESGGRLMPCSTTQGALLPDNALPPKDTRTQWPENYFNLFGSWEGEPLQLQRPEQSHDEQRPSDEQA